MLNSIVLGDCNAVLKEIPDASIDLVLTDAPYGMNFCSNRQTAGKFDEPYFDAIAGDESLPVDWLAEAFRVLKDGTALYVYCHWRLFHDLSRAVEAVGFKTKNMIVCAKSHHGMGDLKGSYAPAHELVLFTAKGRHLLNGKRPCDVMPVTKPFTRSFRPHPNYKPASWHVPFIEASSEVGDVVLDPFCGSGQTLVAAKKLGRNWLGIEIDPKYHALASAAVASGK